MFSGLAPKNKTGNSKAALNASSLKSFLMTSLTDFKNWPTLMAVSGVTSSSGDIPGRITTLPMAIS